MAAEGADFRALFLRPGVATFEGEAAMPPLPLPQLGHTLNRWLDSCRPLLTAKELRQAQQAAQQFQQGPGGRLDAALRRRAEGQRNWLERWWLQRGYLALRRPLLPFLSMSGALPLPPPPPGAALQRAALYLHHLTAFWLALRREQLLPAFSADGRTAFSMEQFRQLFNCVRVPRPGCDELRTFFCTEAEGPCPDHAVLLCGGRAFRLRALEAGGQRPLAPSGWERQLQLAKARVAAAGRGPGLALLSCDQRDHWAKNRAHLASLSESNACFLHDIDSAMFVAVLDDAEPGSETETIYQSVCGDYRNRWADKSLSPVFFANGAVGGLCDHTAFDGAISVTALYYVHLALATGEPDPGLGPDHEPELELQTEADPEPEPEPAELTFSIDSRIRGELARAEREVLPNALLVSLVQENYCAYGRALVQSHRLHPDTYAQLALQLAYLRLHGRPAPTYETASTRGFFHGRTETLRSCTVEAVHWARAMLNDYVPLAERRRLLQRAVQRHDELMAEAKAGAGCDRHLFALQVLAAEEGEKEPELFSQQAFLRSGGGGNFVLSTSLLGYTPIGGSVSPMCLDGYGCFYNLLHDRLCFTISVFNASTETSARKFYRSLERSLDDMRTVLEAVPASRM